jgi:hypothetical protein
MPLSPGAHGVANGRARAGDAGGVRLPKRGGRGCLRAVALAVASLCASPAVAAAITTPRARQIALRILAPQHQPGNPVVYGLPSPLGARQAVFPVISGSGEIPASRTSPGILDKEHPIGQRAWLFWEDLAPGARFEHPSRLLLISDRTGRPLRNQAYSWWPLVDGRNPPFIAAGSGASRYQIYPGAGGSRIVHRTRDDLLAAALRPFSPLAPVAFPADVPPGPIQLPSDGLKGECIIEIGLDRDPMFGQDFTGLDQTAAILARYGLKGPFVPEQVTDSAGRILADADGKALQNEVTDAITYQDCTDILIYIDGHGYPAPGSKYPNGNPVPAGDASPHAQVLVGYRWIPNGRDAQGNQKWHKTRQTVDSTDLKAILLAHPTTGFKFKIDSCFSGRFVDDLPKQKYPNLVVLETASNDREYAWGYVRHAWLRNGKFAQPGAPGAVHYVNHTNNPGNTNFRGYGRSEFTNGNLSGINKFITDPQRIDLARSQGGSLLGHMLADAFITGSTDDFAQTIGIMHPQLESNLPAVAGPGGSGNSLGSGTGAGTGSGTGGGSTPKSLSASISSPSAETVFLGDDNPTLAVAGQASDGSPPYTSFAWTTNPSRSTQFGQSQTLTFPGEVSLTNGRASDSYMLTVTDSHGNSASATKHVIIACNTTRVTTGDIGDGPKALFEACGKIDTHGVQPYYVRFTITGNLFSGAFNVFEMLPSATCPITTATEIECDPAKLTSENPLGFLGGVFETANALAPGQSILIEVFDASHNPLGSIEVHLQ